MIGYIWSNGGLFSILVAFAMAIVLTCAFMARTGRRSRGLAIRAGVVSLSVSSIPAATLTRFGWPTMFSPAGALHWASGGWARFTSDFGTSEEMFLNMLLFVPAGVALTLWRRHPLYVLIALSLLSGVIEVVQGMLGVGNPDVADLLCNSIGAFIGVMIGSTALMLSRGRSGAVGWQLAALAASATCLVASVPTLAAHHRSEVMTQINAQFRNDTLHEWQTWSAQGTLGDRVFRAAGTYSDGSSNKPRTVTVRYPASFLGVRQCVYAVWSDSGVAVTGRSGPACSVFLG